MINKLKDKRTEVGLTQEQLAQMIGSSKQYISQLENGDRDIRRLRQDTIQRICAALNCDTDDLIVLAKFEYDSENRLIVDNLWYDPALPNNRIIEIDGDYFIAPTFYTFLDNSSKPITKEQLRPMLKKLSVASKKLPQHNYLMFGCVPRGGFKVEIGRAITDEDLSNLIREYNLSEDDISGEFIDTKGGIYGDSAKVSFTAIQIKVPSGATAISIENKLRDKGIEVANITSGRINIRVR